MISNKIGRSRKQFCSNGHDMSLLGRDKWGKCNGCVKPVSLGLRPRIRKQICINGHDTSVVGRNKHGVCKGCEKINNQKHYTKYKDIVIRVIAKQRKNRRELLDDIKKVPCMDCGNRYPACAMDFDHRPDEIKLFNIAHKMHSRSLIKLQQEIAKCDIICANCHRIRTQNRLDGKETKGEE